MGERPSHWTPTTTGAGFEFSPILKPLEPFRDYVTVVSNIDRPPAGTHAVSTGTWLTGARRSAPRPRTSSPARRSIRSSPAKIGRDTVFPSLEIATEDLTGYVGACDVGYSCAYMNTISWKSPTTPMPMETNPRVVFERMFGRPGSPEERLRAHAAEPQHPRLGARRRRVARAGPGRARPRAARPVPRARARDRSAHPARRAEGGHRARCCRRRRSAFPSRGKSTPR